MPALFAFGLISLGQPMLAKEVPESSDATFSKDVLEAQKPVVVDFFATWCGPCKEMAPVVDDLSKTYDGKASFLKVDVDKNPQLAEKYKISGIPSIMIFKNGQVVDSSIGLVPSQVLSGKIDAVVSGKAVAKN
jgi:thioredoxin 1